MLALEEQLHALAGQRDAAVLQLSVAREEAENNAAALRNLQSVLEQFQRGVKDWFSSLVPVCVCVCIYVCTLTCFCKT